MYHNTVRLRIENYFERDLALQILFSLLFYDFISFIHVYDIYSNWIYIYYTLYLKQTIRDSGFFQSDETTIETQPVSIAPTIQPVQGTTVSRLDEVKTYNKARPYIVGVNNVTEVTDIDVSYIIDGIVFTTSLITGITQFAFGVAGLTRANSESYPMLKDERDDYTTKTPTQNNIFIQRNEISVFSNIYKLSRVDTLDDFKLYF